MEDKIKFCDVPIGARFKWQKTNEEAMKVGKKEFLFKLELYSLENYDFYKLEDKVELVSKCGNCNLNNKCNIAKFMLGDNKFSCSLFEIKNLGE